MKFVTLLSFLIATVSATADPFINDECIDAKFIPFTSLPYSDIVDIANYTNNNITDPIPSCYSFENATDGKTLWYKFVPPTDGLLSVLTNDLRPRYGPGLDLIVSIYTGSCSNLTEDACTDLGYAAESFLYRTVREGVTYYIKVGEGSEVSYGNGIFNFTAIFDPSDLTVVGDECSDAKSPRNVIGVLNDVFSGAYAELVPANTIDYSKINTTSLAIEAKFAQPTLIRSALLKLNDVPVVCENVKPYALSGPFALGNRLVTATGYSGANCRGDVIASISQSFTVRACEFLQYGLYDSDRNIYLTNMYNASTVSSPPCNMNIGVTFQCGFVPDNVRLELRRASTNTLVARLDQNEAPYFLFGDYKGNIFSGSVPAGEYIISARINGVLHPSVRFTLGVCKRNKLLVDNSFDIDLCFDNGYASMYDITKLFPFLILTLGLGESWEAFNLASRTDPCNYTGTKAVEEFNAITGCSSDSIPLDINPVPFFDGFTSFDCLYWDPACLRNEVLPYTLGEKKVSRITLGSLEDLGYVVNYTAADPYGIDDIGTCGCNSNTRALLRTSVESKDEEPKSSSSSSSCYQGEVYNHAVVHGRKMLKKMHDHHLKQMEHTSLPEGIEFVGHKRITVAYMHEDGTLCSAIVHPSE